MAGRGLSLRALLIVAVGVSGVASLKLFGGAKPATQPRETVSAAPSPQIDQCTCPAAAESCMCPATGCAPAASKFGDLPEQVAALSGLLQKMWSTDADSGLGAPFQPAIIAKTALDLTEERDAYIVHVDVPGIKKHELSIQCCDNHMLAIRGERRFVPPSKDEPSDTEKDSSGVFKALHRLVERNYGHFERVLRLPSDAEGPAKATVKHGVLTVAIPKAPPGKRASTSVEIEFVATPE